MRCLASGNKIEMMRVPVSHLPSKNKTKKKKEMSIMESDTRFNDLSQHKLCVRQEALLFF